MRHLNVALLLLVLLGLTTAMMPSRAEAGLLGGAIGGALIGGLVGGRKGAAAGAIVGGIAGATSRRRR